MWSKMAVVAVVLAQTAMSSAQGVTYPFKFHKEVEIGPHQMGYVDVVIGADGKGKSDAAFSNASHFPNSNFYSIVVLRTKDGSVIKAIIQEQVVYSMMEWQMQSGYDTEQFLLTAEELARFDHVDYDAGLRDCKSQIISFNGNTFTFSTKCTPP
jgi:hypothetical protein